MKYIITIKYGNGDVSVKEYATKRGAKLESDRLSQSGYKIFNNKMGYTDNYSFTMKKENSPCNTQK